jgi:hypothetical protein
MRIIIVTLALLSGAVFFRRRERNCAGLPKRPRGRWGNALWPQTAVSRCSVQEAKLASTNKRKQGGSRGETLTAIAKSYNVSHMTICSYRHGDAELVIASLRPRSLFYCLPQFAFDDGDLIERLLYLTEPG